MNLSLKRALIKLLTTYLLILIYSNLILLVVTYSYI